MCQTVIHQPKGNTAYRRPQFHVQDNHPIYGARPYTQQSRGCGQPGDYTGLPFNFLTTWNNTWETFGDPAKLFVKEWAKLRYGIFDELGFAGKAIINVLKLTRECMVHLQEVFLFILKNGCLHFKLFCTGSPWRAL